MLEIKEADVESILSAYQEARSPAQTAKCHKLECRVLSSMIQVLKDNDRLSEASKQISFLFHLFLLYTLISYNSLFYNTYQAAHSHIINNIVAQSLFSSSYFYQVICPEKL